MDFFEEFLKINQESDVSLTEFLLQYDIQNKTVYSLTLNYKHTYINILKKVLRDFLQSADVSHIDRVSEKIDYMIKGYLFFLEQNNIHISVQKIYHSILNEDLEAYWKYMLYFSGKIWNYLDVYDEDHNFTTRRIALAKMLHSTYAQVLYNADFSSVVKVPQNKECKKEPSKDGNEKINSIQDITSQVEKLQRAIKKI